MHVCNALQERQVNHAMKTGHASSSQAPVLQEFHTPKLSLIPWHQQGCALTPDHTVTVKYSLLLHLVTLIQYPGVLEGKANDCKGLLSGTVVRKC